VVSHGVVVVSAEISLFSNPTEREGGIGRGGDTEYAGLEVWFAPGPSCVDRLACGGEQFRASGRGWRDWRSQFRHTIQSPTSDKLPGLVQGLLSSDSRERGDPRRRSRGAEHRTRKPLIRAVDPLARFLFFVRVSIVS